MSVCSSITRTKLVVPDRRKMLLLSQEMQVVGCLEGFKHFTMYLRSSEELVITVLNSNKDTENVATDRLELVNFDPVMIDREHPPSSPCRHTPSFEDDEYTSYLVGCYETYRRPFVWVRTGHERLVQRCEMYGTVDRDSPIDLLSMTRYMVDSISIWDIIAELVLLTTEPPPANPFDIDHTFLDNLTSAEQAISTGSLLHSLNSLLGKDSVWATPDILRDMKHLALRHVHTLPSLE